MPSTTLTDQEYQQVKRTLAALAVLPNFQYVAPEYAVGLRLMMRYVQDLEAAVEAAGELGDLARLLDGMSAQERQQGKAVVNDVLIPQLARLLSLLLLREDGSLYNCVEWGIGSSGDPEIGDLTLTLQRSTGLTPMQLKAEAEAQRDAARAQLLELARAVGLYLAGPEAEGYERLCAVLDKVEVQQL